MSSAGNTAAQRRGREHAGQQGSADRNSERFSARGETSRSWLSATPLPTRITAGAFTTVGVISKVMPGDELSR